VNESERREQNRRRLLQQLDDLLEVCAKKLDAPVSKLDAAEGVISPPVSGSVLPNVKVQGVCQSGTGIHAIFRAATQLYERYVIGEEECSDQIAYEVALVFTLWAKLNAQNGSLADAMGLAADAQRAFDTPDTQLGEKRRKQQHDFGASANAERQKSARERHATWLEVDEHVRKENPHLVSKRRRAELVQQRLDETVAADRIARILPSAK